MRAGLLALLMLLTAGHAAILRVPGDFPTIQAALDSTISGDTVHVAPGNYFEHLVTPIWSVTMLSDYAWTGDSLDIEHTIIDGSWTGTVLTVNAWWVGHFRLEGFTLQRGMGTPSEKAGGVNFREWANATLRHVVLKEHRCPRWSNKLMDGVYIPGFRGRLVLEDLRFELDTMLTGGEVEPNQVYISGWRSIQARKLRFKQVANPGGLITFSADSVVISDVMIDRHGYQSSPADGVLSCYAEQFLFVDSVNVQNAMFKFTPVNFATGNEGYLHVNHLLLENLDLRLPEWDMYATYGLTLITGGHVLVENWTHRHCTTNVGYCVGFVAGFDGAIRNLLAENLVAGTPLSPQADCEGNCTGGGLFVDGLSLDRVVFRNVTINPFDTYPPAHATRSEPVIYSTVEDFHTADSLFFRNVEVSHVLINDPDDYGLPETDCTASLGRAFSFHTNNLERPITVVMDSCRFVENRQPNTQPERLPQAPMPGGTRMVGSTVWLTGTLTQDSHLILRNTTLLHNDDGGLEAIGFGNLDVDNVVLVDNSRMGVYLSAMDSIRANSLFIAGTNSHLAYLTYPYSVEYPSYQCVARINGHGGTNLENITYDDNHTEFLFWCAREDFQDRTYYQNSLFSNNTFDHFTNPWYDSSLFPPPLFDYCYLPIAQPGIGNMIGQEAHFDLVHGAPFLALDSPCIDAGNPASVCNDAEDPASPGFPLWPSLGSLRNDIGFTGGPHAALLDTNWVGVTPWEPRTTLWTFALGAPWPNPFNPVTQIPVLLARPSLARLTVHNVLGQQVAVLHDGLLPAGRHVFRWDARRQASGLYFLTLTVDLEQTRTRAVTLLR